jgi:hypothetical protein
MRKEKTTPDVYALLGRIVKDALAALILKTDLSFNPRKWLTRADVVCVIDSATGNRSILHGIDSLRRSLRDQPGLNLVMITVDLGSSRFASIRALVKAVKGKCTDIPVDADFEPDPSRN